MHKLLPTLLLLQTVVVLIISEAPEDGKCYVRQDAAWVDASAKYVVKNFSYPELPKLFMMMTSLLSKTTDKCFVETKRSALDSEDLFLVYRPSTGLNYVKASDVGTGESSGLLFLIL